MIDTMFSNKLVRLSVLGATVFHIFLAAVSALNHTPVNEMGIFSVILGVLCIAAVIFTSRYAPFIGPVLACIIIYIPGAIIGAMVKVILVGGLVAIIAAPGWALMEILITAFPWLFL